MKDEMMITLSLYPNERGLCYVCLENQKTILDSGIMSSRVFTNDRVVERIKKFMDFHKPTLLVIRDQDSVSTKRGERIKRLQAQIIEHTRALNIPIYQYSRKQVQDVFEIYGVTTKYDIAKQIIVWFPELVDKAPKIRKPWMNEDYNMGIFDALALAITHHYLML